MAFGITLINHNNIKLFKHLEEINWSFSFLLLGVDGVFYLGSPFSFSSKLGRKDERK